MFCQKCHFEHFEHFEHFDMVKKFIEQPRINCTYFNILHSISSAPHLFTGLMCLRHRSTVRNVVMHRIVKRRDIRNYVIVCKLA